MERTKIVKEKLYTLLISIKGIKFLSTTVAYTLDEAYHKTVEDFFSVNTELIKLILDKNNELSFDFKIEMFSVADLGKFIFKNMKNIDNDFKPIIKKIDNDFKPIIKKNDFKEEFKDNGFIPALKRELNSISKAGENKKDNEKNTLIKFIIDSKNIDLIKLYKNELSKNDIKYISSKLKNNKQ